MSCISWNCRGLGNPRTVRALYDRLKDHKPNFLFLIETISFANKIEELRVRFGFDQCFSVDRVGRSGGLTVFWKRPLQCEISGYSQHHTDVLFLENNSASWRLSCYYGYRERTRRKESWNLIRRLANISSLPWLIWGDFNDLLHASDKKGAIPHPQILLDGFRNVVEECHLSELNSNGGKFTWEKSKGTNAWVREKLDRGFAMMSWWNKFHMYNLKVLHSSVSDHEPILLKLFKVDINKKTFRFRFENVWLKDPSFIKDVTEAWKAIHVSHLLPKHIEVSSFMARSGRSFFHKFREKVKEHKENLDKLVDCCDAQSVQAYIEEKEKLNTLLLHEETYWKQRATLFWLQDGDENTKYFHCYASTRKKANKISFL